MADSIPVRLQDQKRKALAELQERLQTWEKFQNDYTTLEEQLKVLPGKISHEIMVPFGSLAFMPGKLIHTNEILVLLGDNWFAERSASQAIEIVKRRQQSIEEDIKSVKNEIDFFSSQLNFNQVLSHVNKDETVEIKEELKDDPGKNKGPRIAHKKAKDFAPKKVEKIDSKTLKRNTLSQEDQDLFANLERLEALERTNHELNKVNEQTQNDNDKYNCDDDENDEKLKSVPTHNEIAAKHSGVSFSHDVKPSIDNSDDSGDSDDSDSKARTTIMVNFTKPSSNGQSTLQSTPDVINTPTDIYTKIKQRPKSILKTPSFEKETDFSKTPLAAGKSTNLLQDEQSNQATPLPSTEKDAVDVLKAFSGQIVERPTTMPDTDTKPVAQLQSTPDVINTPTDIYTKIKQRPKSILKTPSFEKETDFSKTPLAAGKSTNLLQDEQSNQATPLPSTEKDAVDVLKAFSGQIVERPTTMPDTDTKPVAQITKSEPKRISKFKAQRKK